MSINHLGIKDKVRVNLEKSVRCFKAYMNSTASRKAQKLFLHHIWSLTKQHTQISVDDHGAILNSPEGFSQIPYQHKSLPLKFQ